MTDRRAAELKLLDDLDSAGRSAVLAAHRAGDDRVAAARERGWVEACALLLARHRDLAREPGELRSAIETIVQGWLAQLDDVADPFDDAEPDDGPFASELDVTEVGWAPDAALRSRIARL